MGGGCLGFLGLSRTEHSAVSDVSCRIYVEGDYVFGILGLELSVICEGGGVVTDCLVFLDWSMLDVVFCVLLSESKDPGC